MLDFRGRKFRARADHNGVVVAVVAEIGARADQRFDVDGEGVAEFRIVNFAKISIGDDHDAANRRLIPAHGAFVFGLHPLPAQIEMRFLIEVLQNFLKLFDG